MRRGIAFLAVLTLAGAGGPTAGAATPEEDGAATAIILDAVTAEEQASSKRAELVWRMGGREVSYLFERVLPDRLHLVQRRDGIEDELYVIGAVAYQRTPSGWEPHPAVPALAPPLSVADLFRTRLEDVAELDPVDVGGITARVFSGFISWTPGGGLCEGEVTIVIEDTSLLPRLLTFDGECGVEPTSFEYSISYDDIEIEPPVP